MYHVGTIVMDTRSCQLKGLGWFGNGFYITHHAKIYVNMLNVNPYTYIHSFDLVSNDEYLASMSKRNEHSLVLLDYWHDVDIYQKNSCRLNYESWKFLLLTCKSQMMLWTHENLIKHISSGNKALPLNSQIWIAMKFPNNPWSWSKTWLFLL